MVDEALAAVGKLTLVGDGEAVARKLRVERKKAPAIQPDPGPLVKFICNAIEQAAEPPGV